MPVLDAAALLDAWERGVAQLPVERALTLLAAAHPGHPAEAWAAASLGERDGRLLDLREALFGPALETVADCERCGEPLELSFRTEDIRVPPAGALPMADEPARRLVADGYEVSFRLPTSADLIAAVSGGDEHGRATLLRRCILSARRGEAMVDPVNLTGDVLAAVAARMAEDDPQADVQVMLSCPVCKHQWPVSFDILSYLWHEVDDWACRLLRDVHILASAYGWSERDILALGPHRRSLYLDLLA